MSIALVEHPSHRYSSELHEFVATWIESKNTTWQWLFKQAGVANASSTLLRRGSIPRPDTLRKLADAMEVPRRKIFELAGYVKAEDLEPEEIDIEDPELRLFFRNYDWDEFTDDEKDLIRQGIRMAGAAKRVREGAVRPEEGEGEM